MRWLGNNIADMSYNQTKWEYFSEMNGQVNERVCYHADALMQP